MTEMPKKPEKEEHDRYCIGISSGCSCGAEEYNNAIDKYEKFLPSADELDNIVANSAAEHFHYRGVLSKSMFIAEAILKRIGKGEV